MKIAGIDLSLTATGVCVLNDGGLSDVALIKSKPDGHRTERIAVIVERVLIACGLGEGGWKYSTEAVAIEGYSFGSKGDALTTLAELRGVLLHRLRRFEDVAVTEIPPGSWRKELFGKGNLRKDEVRLAVERKFKNLSHDLADQDINVVEAFCVAMAAHRRSLPKITP